jgi:hypothetical protein
MRAPNSCTASKPPRSRAVSRSSTASLRAVGSSARTGLGKNAPRSAPRSFVCSGGSIRLIIGATG